MSKHTYLTKDQVFELNEKHGYFMYADAQGDTSRAFAKDVIDTYERMRDAAPDLLEALSLMLRLHEVTDSPEGEVTRMARAAIAKAKGEQP